MNLTRHNGLSRRGLNEVSFALVHYLSERQRRTAQILAAEIEHRSTMSNLTSVEKHIGQSMRKRARRFSCHIGQIPGTLAIPFGTIAFEADDGGWHSGPPCRPSSAGSVTDQVTPGSWVAGLLGF